MGKVTYYDIEGGNEQIIEYDDELSFRNFANWDFNDRPEYDFTGKVIYASVFTNETPDSSIFSPPKAAVSKDGEGTFSARGSTLFVKCHLQNVILPPGARLLDCLTDRFAVQNDLQPWIIDQDNNPIEPLHKNLYEKYRIPLPDPKDLPAVRVDKPKDFEEIKKGGR